MASATLKAPSAQHSRNADTDSFALAAAVELAGLAKIPCNAIPANQSRRDIPGVGGKTRIKSALCREGWTAISRLFRVIAHFFLPTFHHFFFGSTLDLFGNTISVTSLK
jgi:hypothetical protein